MKHLYIIAVVILLYSCKQSNFVYEHLANKEIIGTHLKNITATDSPRNYRNLGALNKVAEYIFKEFKKYADTVYYQPYLVDNIQYKNVICVFGSKLNKTVVVGAHYDVCGDQGGADDNASGVVGLLEIARLLKEKELKNRIELVAFTLEEPPYFRTEYMGSYIHAKSLANNDVNVQGMICLEMIGYFDDTKGSQDYPLPAMGLLYGSKGNFIALINKFNKGSFSRNFNKLFKKQDKIRTVIFSGPKKLKGLDFSDHLNYWKFGYSALMITDTSFYRNKNYHKKTDTIKTLDISKMAQVIDATFLSLVSLS